MIGKKEIPGFEIYSVGTDGIVINKKTGRILKPSLAGKGYYTVTLSNNNIKRREYIHRLVAEAFIPNPDAKKQVNHINGIMTDNMVENLEWATPKENINHAYKIGLCPTRIKALQGSKLSEAQVLEIRKELRNNKSRNDLSLKYSVHTETIRYIETRRTWSHI